MTSIWNVLWVFLQEYPWTLVLYTLCTLLSFPLESICVPAIYSRFFDTLHTVAAAKKTVDTAVFLKFIIVLFVVVAVVNAANVATLFIESSIIPEMCGFFYNFIFINILLKNEKNLGDIEIGKIITRLLTIPDTLRNLLTTFCVWFFPRALTILVINVYFFVVSWKLGLFSVVLVAVYATCAVYFFNHCIGTAKNRHERLEQTNQYTQDKLSNTQSIYATGNLENEMRNYQATMREYTNQYKSSLSCLKYDVLWLTICLVIIYILLHMCTIYLYYTKEISIFILISIFITIIYYMPCLYAMNSVIPDFITDIGIVVSADSFIQDLYEQHRENIEHGRSPTPPKIKITRGDILIQNLHFGFLPDRPPIFDQFNLSIKSEERVALVGPSGNGKSTLVKLMMGYYKVPPGVIFFDGVDINQFTINDLRKQITYVHQNNKLFETSVIENIKYGNQCENDQEIADLLAFHQLDGIFKSLRDDFLHFNVGVEGNHLSGGQRQMIIMLRALLKKNKIVILDEPTTALDGESKQAVIKAIDILGQNNTLIIITHDPDVLSLVDRIVTLDAGRVVSDEGVSRLQTTQRSTMPFAYI
jgi:ABC-type bacteriocin/lantibiotic exporter with double-glycine peptidase domain